MPQKSNDRAADERRGSVPPNENDEDFEMSDEDEALEDDEDFEEDESDVEEEEEEEVE